MNQETGSGVNSNTFRTHGRYSSSGCVHADEMSVDVAVNLKKGSNSERGINTSTEGVNEDVHLLVLIAVKDVANVTGIEIPSTDLPPEVQMVVVGHIGEINLPKIISLFIEDKRL